jgi:hypothetical protein
LAPGLLSGDGLLPTASCLITTSADPTNGVQLSTPVGSRFWQLYSRQDLPITATVVSDTGAYIDFSTPISYPSHVLWPVGITQNLDFSGAAVASATFLAQFFVQP